MRCWHGTTPQLKGVQWVRSQTKQQLVSYARAYMFQHRKANTDAGYQLSGDTNGDADTGTYQGGMPAGVGGSGGGASSSSLTGGVPATGSADGGVPVGVHVSTTDDVVDFTVKSYHADLQRSAQMMATAVCKFLTIHTFCFVVCLATLLVALNRVST